MTSGIAHATVSGPTWDGAPVTTGWNNGDRRLTGRLYDPYADGAAPTMPIAAVAISSAAQQQEETGGSNTSYASDGPQEPPADAVESLRIAIVQALKQNPDIQIALAIVTTLAVEWISAFGFFVAGRHQGETGAERHGGSVGHGAPVPQPHAFSIDVTGSGVTAHPTFPGMEQLMRWKRERLEAADGQSLARDVAYLDYLSWVGQQAHEETLSVVIFHRLLARTIPALGAAYPGWRLREARRQVVSA